MREIHLKNSLIGIFAVAKITKIHILIQIELLDKKWVLPQCVISRHLLTNSLSFWLQQLTEILNIKHIHTPDDLCLLAICILGFSTFQSEHPLAVPSSKQTNGLYRSEDNLINGLLNRRLAKKFKNELLKNHAPDSDLTFRVIL